LDPNTNVNAKVSSSYTICYCRSHPPYLLVYLYELQLSVVCVLRKQLENNSLSNNNWFPNLFCPSEHPFHQAELY